MTLTHDRERAVRERAEVARATERTVLVNDRADACVQDRGVRLGDDWAHMREQCRWFGGMVGNHVADIVAKYGDSSSSDAAQVPQALTEYIKGREGYDYNEHGRAGNAHAQFVPDEIVDRFCILGTAKDHVDKLKALQAIGVDQFAGYLQHDNKEETLRVYGEEIIPEMRENVTAKA